MSNLIPPPSTLPPSANVWAYLRDSGGQGQDRSIQRQLESITEYCRIHQLNLVQAFSDIAKTGTNTSGRDNFHRMISLSKHREENAIDGLLIWNYARFARDLDDSQYYKSLLRRRGLIIHSLTDPIPEGPYGHVIETVIDIANEEKSRQTSIDARDGLRSIVQQGAVPGSPPRGFKREPIVTYNSRTGQPRTNHRWVPDPTLTPLIKQAFEMRASGSTLAQIHTATHLYGSINSYRTFFTNPIYIGILEFGDMVIEDYCEPIVDIDTWKKVQTIIEKYSADRNGPRHPRRANSIYLLSGLLYCARCGSPTFGNTVSRPSKTGRDEAYRCSRARRRRDCDAGRINRHAIEKAVIETIKGYILLPSNLQAVHQIALENQEKGETGRHERRQSLMAERLSLSRSIANITKAIADAGHSSALLDKLNELEVQRASLQQEINQLDIPVEPIPDYDESHLQTVSNNLIKILDGPDTEQARQVLRSFVHKVVAERDGKEIHGMITYYYPPATKEHDPPFGRCL